jgi:hypothetical protein
MITKYTYVTILPIYLEKLKKYTKIEISVIMGNFLPPCVN